MREAGFLPLPFGMSKRGVFAGSYKNRLPGTYGIKLAPEIQAQANVNVPIKDFGTPLLADAISTVKIALYQISLGNPVYVGCFGGYGRTGTMLSLIVKALGEPWPIDYVRDLYDDRAVETQAQEKYVEAFPVAAVSLDVWRARNTAALVDFTKRFGTRDLGYPGGYTNVMKGIIRRIDNHKKPVTIV